MLKKTGKTVKFVTVALLVGIILGVLFARFVVGNPGAEYYTFENAPGAYSWIVWEDSGSYYYRDMETGVKTLASSDDDALQYAVNETTAAGGSVFVRAGTYSASVTLKDNVTLILQKGAAGITVSIDAGADAKLTDLNSPVVEKEWEAGVLVYHRSGGSILVSQDIDTASVYVAEISNRTAEGYVNLARMVVESGSAFPSSPTEGYLFFNSNYELLTIYNGSSWINCTTGDLINIGVATSCVNGTWITHGLGDNPETNGSITLSLRGPSIFNATIIYRVPTVLESNSTHFQLEMTMWETGGWTQVPVTTLEACSVYWIATIKGATAGSGVTDHGSLTGLEDDDHPIYLLASGSRALTADWNVGNYGIYSLTTINVTTIYVDVIQANGTSGVQIAELRVESGTSFPVSPLISQLFLRTDHKVLYAYDGGGWEAVGFRHYDNLTGTPDLSVYLLKDGSASLTADWNVGTHGIYGVTWLNATDINITGDLYFNQGQAINMTFWSGTSFPSNPVEGQPFWRTDLNVFYVYNGTDWATVGSGATGPAGPAGTVQGMDYSYMVFENATATYLLNGETGIIDDSSSDSDVVMNWALANVSATDYEKVVFKGEFTIDATLEIYDCTILEVQGKITLANNAASEGGTMIKNEDQVGGNYRIKITGGIWDGNKANQGSIDNFIGLYFTHVTDFSVSNVYMKNMRSTGYQGKTFRFEDCENGEVVDCESRLGEGIAFQIAEDSYGIKVVRPKAIDNEREGFVFYGGDTYTVENCHVIDGYFENNGDNGVDFYGKCSYCSVIGSTFRYNNNTLHDPTPSGEIGGGHAGKSASYCLVANNDIYASDNSWGIKVSPDSEGWVIIGNVIKGGNYGIQVSTDGHKISDNRIDTPVQHGIYVYAESDNNQITGNYVEGIPSSKYGIYYYNSATYPVNNMASDNFFNNSAAGRTIGGRTTGNYAHDNFDVGAGWITES